MEKHITHYLLFAYFLFIAGYFLTPNGVDHYKFLVLFVLLPGLLLSRQLYDSVNHDSTFALLVVYLLYTLASATWSQTPDYAQLGRHAAQALLILFFVALTAFLSYRQPAGFHMVLLSTVAVAAASAVLSILLWDTEQDYYGFRLVGLGTLREPNSAGAVYGFHAVLCLALLHNTRTSGARLALSAGGVVLLGFLLLTQSRGAIAAAVVGLMVLAAGRFHRRLNAWIYGLALLCVGAATLLAHESFQTHYAERSASWNTRIELWSGTVQHIANAPLFGNGYLSGLEVYSETENRSFASAHNSYLAALRDGGAVGLALLLALLLAALQRAVSVARSSGSYATLALLCFGLVYMLISTDNLITRPRELWPILWFPVGLLVAQRRAASAAAGATD